MKMFGAVGRATVPAETGRHFDLSYDSFVGWVELTPSIVGFRCTQPNLHFAGVFAKCETQQQPISELSP